MPLLTINNLHADIDGHSILQGIDLTINLGEVHALMGPNGSGKSTLAKAIAGHPSIDITKGDITYDINGTATPLKDHEADFRSREGIFLALQYPIEIPGISNFNFLKESFNTICKHQGGRPLDDKDFKSFLKPKLELLDMDSSFLSRSVNEGFSGGEKKKNELLQMAVLNPRLRLLDETDSGLDIDSLKTVAHCINALKNNGNATVLVTHYQRLLDHVVPDYVHIIDEGKIIRSGGKEVALDIEEKGYTP